MHPDFREPYTLKEALSNRKSMACSTIKCLVTYSATLIRAFTKWGQFPCSASQIVQDTLDSGLSAESERLLSPQEERRE